MPSIPTSPASAVHVDTCGVHFPRLMSDANALQQPALGDVYGLYGGRPWPDVTPEPLWVVGDTGVRSVPLDERPLVDGDGLPAPALIYRRAVT